MTEKPTQLLSMPTAAARLDTSRTHIYRLIATGQLRHVDISTKGTTRSKTRVLESDLEDYIQRSIRPR